MALLEHLNDLPVTAVLVLPPYYFKPVEVEGLRRYYERVLEVSRHPVLAYHIPKYAVPVPAELVTSLPLWGVKNSAGDPESSAAVRAAGQGVLLGSEDDLPGQLPQADGGSRHWPTSCPSRWSRCTGGCGPVATTASRSSRPEPARRLRADQGARLTRLLKLLASVPEGIGLWAPSAPSALPAPEVLRRRGGLRLS